MMSGYKAECRKFQANIFNKSKCTNCFKQREEHSSDALDSNRASRKVSKCGYLFVAPDWDFTIPLYRTKRWQRRWFVLYDDGELTYSVDDLPATIPQGVVDMNRVLEVSSAEDVTGNQYSLAITAPDRVTFVKGTCMEETRWWQDVLSVFPRMHKHGRHKRNATFPGIKGTSGTAASTAAATAVRQPVNRGSDRVPSTLESPVNHRVRFHSISSEHLRATRRPSSAPSLDSTHHHQSLYSSHLHHKSSCSSSSSSSHQYDSVNESSNGSEDDDTANNNQKNSFYSSALSNNNNTTSSSTCSTPNNIQNSSTPAAFSPTFTTSDSYHQSFPYNHNNSSKTITPYHTPIASTQSLHYTRTPPLPTPSSTAASSPLTANPPPAVPASSPPPFTSTPSSKLLMDEHKENTPPYTPDYEDNPPTSESPPTQDKQAHRLRTRRAWNREARALSQPRSEQQQQSSVLADLEASKREEKLKDIAASITTTSSRRRSHHLASQVRGAPDGCGVSEHSSNNSLQRVDLPAEDLLFVKKGWLLTLADNQEWNKYWFVLRGTGLRFYRNASSEEKGILDGIIDLGTAKDIHNLDVGRNYGFVIKTWSEKQHVFSAVTAGIRINWIQALKKAANLKDDSDVELTKTTTKSATIESVSAERDIPIATKCLQAYNNEKNSNYYSYTSSEPLKSISPDNVSNGGKDLKDQQIISTHEDSSLNHQTHINGGLHNRSTMSSDEDEYKTASEASNAINTSHEYADIYELERSRSRNSSGGQNLNNRRTCSSPPTSRRGYGDNFSSVADFTSLGFNKNLLDKYKNMQTMAKARSSTHLSSVEDTVDGGPTKKDASTIRLTDSIKSLDFETTLNDKMSSSVTLASGSGDALLVDLLETQVETLKAKLEATQMEQLMLQQHKRHGVPQDSLRSPISEPESPSFRQPDGRSVQPSRLSNEELTTLEVLQRENATLTRQLTESEAELAEVKETLKCEKSEAYKWKDLVKELRSLLDGKNQDIDKKREEARLARENLRSLQKDYDVTKDRLQRGIEENEALTASLRELQRQLQSQDKRSQPSLYNSKEKFNHTSSNSRRSLPRLASLSDLTNVDFTLDPETLDRETLDHEYCEVRMRLERSIAEIHTLRRQLKESHSAHDSLQLTELQLTQDLTRQKQDSESQLKLMTERVQDLTNKLNNSEKQVRQLRTKMTRAESKDRRRSHSLKGKDSYGLGRDVDVKLSQLEARIDQLMPTIEGVEDTNSLCTEDSRTTEEQSIPSTNSSFRGSKMGRRSRSIDDPGKVGRLRRKSLESSATTDSVKTAVRINSLEAKVAALTPAISDSPQQSLSEVQMRTPSGRSKSRDRNVSRTRRTEGDGRSAAEQTILDSICSQLCECMDWLGLYRCSCGKSDLSSLHQRLSSIHHVCFTGVQTGSSTYSSHSSTEKVHPVAQQVVRLLQSKLSLLADRRQNLKASNSWTKEAQMKNFAERLAYETVLLSQVSQALQLSNQSDLNLDSVKLQDLMESHRKMAFLEKKLTNPEFDLDTMAPLEFYTSMLAEKLVVTGEVLSSVTTGNASHYDAKLKATCRDLQGRLLERESQLARLITRYKEEKLHEVAVVMAQDINSNVDETVLMEEVRIREAWNTAHQLLQQEIVNHQTSQSLLRLSHLLNLKSDNKENNALTSLSLTICSAEAMDRIQTAAEESLRQEMEESVLTLSQKYEEVLSKYRNGDTSLINSVSATIEEVLTEFAGIMAQKAIIDGHLSLLQDEFDKGTIQTTQEPLVISEDNKDIMESVGDVLDSEAHLLMFLGSCDSSVESLVKPAMTQAELTFIFNKYSGQNTSELQELLSQILAQKPEVSEPIISSSSYRSSTRSLIHCSPTASDKDQENLVGTDLPQLRSATSLSKITASPKSRRKSDSRKSRRSSDITGMTSGGCRQCEEYKLELSKYRRKLQPQECPKCPQLLDTIERLEEAQRAVAASRVESSDSDDQLNELKQRLLLIEQGYEEQILRLKQQYEEALSEHPDRCDESMRHKYQTEIEHLRDLCEKGLGTMENSQRRIVSEIKEKHRRELTLLQAEKDQALAEETKATIAALDAMRKAHEAEVQREVAKIKEEFIRKMQSNEDISEITQQHEAEMQDIRQQILSLSEKYSAKCLESANLESQIEGLNKQLSACNKNIRELESRNEKLRDQLTANITGIKGSSSSFDAQTKGQTAESPTKESSKGDAAQKTQTHEAQVLEVCRQLHEYIKCDKPLLSTDHLASLASRLQDLSITASTTDLRDYTERTKRETRPNLRRPKVYSSKELTRSPSCPRLGGSHTPRLVVPRICDDSLDPHSPLSGMVASRKKVFENGDGSLSSHILTPLQVAKISL